MRSDWAIDRRHVFYKRHGDYFAPHYLTLKTSVELITQGVQHKQSIGLNIVSWSFHFWCSESRPQVAQAKLTYKKKPCSFAHVVRRYQMNTQRNADHAALLVHSVSWKPSGTAEAKQIC